VPVGSCGALPSHVSVTLQTLFSWHNPSIVPPDAQDCVQLFFERLVTFMVLLLSPGSGTVNVAGLLGPAYSLAVENPAFGGAAAGQSELPSACETDGEVINPMPSTKSATNNPATAKIRTCLRAACIRIC
jgi:hypothetical protein